MIGPATKIADQAASATTWELTRQCCPSAFVEELYSKRKLRTPDGRETGFDVYIPRDEGDLLYSLVRQLRPDVSIEVGMARGFSTLFIGEALRDNGAGRHIAIDPFQRSDWDGTGLALIQQAGLDHLVELVEMPSHQALPQLERGGIRAQIVFIDGSHLFDYVLTDFLCADRILDVGGCLAFDDSDWPAVAAVLRYVIRNRHYRVANCGAMVEQEPYTPTMFGAALRSLGRAVPRLGEKLRPDFLEPDAGLGIAGRCIVLQKLYDDDRDSQSKFHRAF
jgi:predicted O-methyltransferase YrrM